MNYAVHPFGLKPVVRSPTVWSPWELGSALSAWWSAADLADGAVAGWMGRKNGINPIQATGGNQPAKSATAFNGYPGVTFDGTADNLALANTTNLPTAAVVGEVWFVGSWASSALVSVAISYGSTGTGNRRTISKDAANLVRASNGSDAVISGGSAVGNQIIGGIFGTTLGLRQNGTRITPDVAMTLATATLRLRIGANTNTTAGEFFNDDFAEALVTTGLLADADRERLEGYWAHLYGIADVLPAGHTYKDQRPVIVP